MAEHPVETSALPLISLPATLTPTAATPSGELMALRHKQYPVYGVQFHPESILTAAGRQLLGNLLRM